MPDRHPSPSPSSIAAVGFALTAYPIGVERGYVTRAEAARRVLTTLRFFDTAPQGPEPAGRTGHRGFFYHFLDMKTGVRMNANVELSTIDTTLLLAGVLFCQSYFDRASADEAEIRALAERIYGRVDWTWAAKDSADRPHGLAARDRTLPGGVADLRRVDDPVPAGARLADAPAARRAPGARTRPIGSSRTTAGRRT